MAFQKNITTTTRAALQTKLAANAADINTIYRITDAVGSTKVIDVIASTVSALYGNAENLTDSTFGVYDIGADTFVAQGGGSGVASVSGNIVDNTDPVNPVVTSPYTKDADNNVFYDGVTATLGTGCTYNTFEQAAAGNNLGNGCTENTFQQSGINNTLGINCTNNTFAQNSSNNNLGAGCIRNRFDLNASANTIGAGSQGNTFEQDAGTNTLGTGCSYNTFESGANSFIFGNGLQYTTIRHFAPGADYTASPDYDFLYGNAYPSEIFYNGTDNYHSYYDPANKRIVLTNLTTLAVTYIGGDGYVTISLATWTALVAASGLVPGTFYRVTAAYTSALFATDFDIEVLATSANTVAENCIIFNLGASLNNGFTPSDGSFSYARIAGTSLDFTITGTLITANNASPINFQPGSWVYINDSSSYKLKANVGSDGVISVENVLCIDPASPQYNLIGIYDVATDVLIPQTIRTQRIVVPTGDIQAGTAIPIPQLPAISGSYWNATNVIVALTAGATPYTTTLFIQANGATNDQWRYALTSATSEKVLIADRRTNGDCFPDNAGMEIQFSGSDFSGDGQAIVWVTAELLTT